MAIRAIVGETRSLLKDARGERGRGEITPIDIPSRDRAKKGTRGGPRVRSSQSIQRIQGVSLTYRSRVWWRKSYWSSAGLRPGLIRGLVV